MQMYLGATIPEHKILHIRDIPKTEGVTGYKWYSKVIKLSGFSTRKGFRRLLICPNCEHRCYEIKYYFRELGGIFCCKKCDPYDKTPYAERTNLNDEDVTALIDYHINKLKTKLEALGVQTDTYFGDIRQVDTTPTIEGILHYNSNPFYPELFDYKSHLWQRPKHMKTMTFKRMLVKLQFLYELKSEARFKQVRCTGEDIRKYTTKEKIDEFIRKHES